MKTNRFDAYVEVIEEGYSLLGVFASLDMPLPTVSAIDMTGFDPQNSEDMEELRELIRRLRTYIIHSQVSLDLDDTSYSYYRVFLRRCAEALEEPIQEWPQLLYENEIKPLFYGFTDKVESRARVKTIFQPNDASLMWARLRRLWTSIDSQYHFIAMDENGRVCAYENQPRLINKKGPLVHYTATQWSAEGSYTYLGVIDATDIDFTKTLLRRPI